MAGPNPVTIVVINHLRVILLVGDIVSSFVFDHGVAKADLV